MTLERPTNDLGRTEEGAWKGEEISPLTPFGRNDKEEGAR